MSNLPKIFYHSQMDMFGYKTVTKMFEGTLTVITKFKDSGFNVSKMNEEDDSYNIHLGNIKRDVMFIYEENVPETLTRQREEYENIYREAKKFINDI